MSRFLGFAYGLGSYALFLFTFAYAVGWVGNFLVPKSIDSPRQGSLWVALLVDLALLALFAVQHSGMARPAFKRWLTRYVPRNLERSTYVLASSVALLVLFALWQPLGLVMWDLQGPGARLGMIGLCTSGWLLVLTTTFLIHHFDLFGLRQAWCHLKGRECPPLRFVTPGPYRVVRHPLYVGWLLAFWATPTMTAAHFLFAGMTTAYILLAIRLEERDLAQAHPEYEEYRRRVPMLVPRVRTPYPHLPAP